ncbi:hypothetical protein ACA29_01210 [Lederbergia galactosidilytica]|uniref:Uncharacterized protein n=1 Tax=Lederbergia galactosidilytica TaxID=217031 RepID=A0A0Q9YKH3_9BACI|nr:hypothetical protein ACA29_01210 [Lederbergia galactosidilytica]
MKDKTVLRLITVLGFSSWLLLFRKGSIKDWFLVYLFKGFVSSLIDTPIARKKLVQYPTRLFPNYYKTNIVFDYVIFPIACVIYSQLTKNVKWLKTILSVFILSIPMTIIEEWLERNTNLVKYSKKWSWLNTLTYLTVTFWSSRIFISVIRFFDRKRKSNLGNVEYTDKI